jgi:hypothetical protein
VVVEGPERLVIVARRWAWGGLLLAGAGAGVLATVAGGGQLAGATAVPAIATFLALAGVGVGLSWFATTHRMTVDRQARDIILVTRLLGIERSREVTSFDDVSAIGVVETRDEGVPHWGVVLDMRGVFPLDRVMRTTVGNWQLPFAEVSVNGHAMRFLAVSSERAEIEDLVEKLQGFIGCPVRGDVARESAPYL